jgi:hypothetical protein
VVLLEQLAGAPMNGELGLEGGDLLFAALSFALSSVVTPGSIPLSILSWRRQL